MRKAKMGGGMMMKRPGMKKGSIPPQLKKFVMAKKKKAKMKKFPKAARDPNSRLRQARRRWKC